MAQPFAPATKPTLMYVMDPLCGWCYGMSGTMEQLEHTFADQLNFEIWVGGMVTGSRAGLLAKSAGYIKGALATVEDRTGMLFGQPFRDLLDSPTAISDSLPPCRAIVAARQLDAARAVAFGHAVQKAHYQQGADLNEASTFGPIAEACGYDGDALMALMQTPENLALTEAEFAQVGGWGINGFPTLLMRLPGDAQQLHLLTRGFAPYAPLAEALHKIASPVGE
jgi:putative protein-disulfide isomerase